MKKLILVVNLFLVSTVIFAQGFDSSTSGFSASIEKTATGEVEDIIDTLYHQNCLIQMINASLISEVHFVLDDEGQGINLYQTQISLTASNDLPEGVSFQLSGNLMTLSLGSYAQTRKLKYTIVLKDVNGHLSDPFIIE